jgi:chromate transporter
MQRAEQPIDPALPRPELAADGHRLATGHGVPFAEAVRVWTYIGVNSFGGPTGQIAVMHRVLVVERRWISEDRFMHALNYCMLLPGPEAMQLATYVGWLMHRTLGGLLAGALFVLPGFVAILALSVAYTVFRDVSVVESLLFGLGAAVLAVVLEALIRIGKKVLHNRLMVAIAAVSFVAIFFLHVPFPLIIVAAGLFGFIGDRFRPDLFEVLRFKSAEAGSLEQTFATDHADLSHTRPSVLGTLSTLAVWLTLWLAPVVVLHLWLGAENVFATQSLFFSKAAAVTFGGAYAVLAYMAQQAVDVYGWLEPGEMLTGLGMAETTPGPLIQVVQFVGYMGAYRDPGTLTPVAAGVLASLLTTWVTFVPCFLWIFVGAPFMEHVRGNRALTAALSTVTAAVVGVILNLAVWFAVHTLFEAVEEVEWGMLHVPLPAWSTIDVPALGIAALASFLLLRRHWGMVRTLALCAALGVIWSLLDPSR